MDGLLDDAEDDRRLVLNTVRLCLRLPCESDLRALATLANNARIAEHLARLPHPFLDADARDWLTRWTPGRDTAKFVVLQGGTLIGAVGVARLEPDAAYPDLGFWIGERYWGHGFGTEAARAVIDHVFETSGLLQLHGGCRVTGRTARRVMQKCGFQYVGDDLIASLYVGGAVAMHRFRLERGIWASLKTWGAAAQ